MRVAIALFLLLCLGSAVGAVEQATPFTFQVTGEAKAVPDVAVLRYSIVTEGDTLAKAKDQMRQTESSIVKAVAKFNIKSEQIQTDSFMVTPLQANLSTSSVQSANLQPLGYRITRSYSIVRTIDEKSLDNLLEIADAIVAQGARPVVVNNNSGYSNQRTGTLMEFVLRDQDKLIQEAVNNALAQARKLAESAAKQTDKPVLKLVHMETSQTRILPGRDENVNVSQNNTGSTVWEPIRATVVVRAGFSN